MLPDGTAYYDGRATKDENFRERTGIVGGATRRSRTSATSTSSPLPGGGWRLFYEAPLPDGSHELRTELLIDSPA